MKRKENLKKKGSKIFLYLILFFVFLLIGIIFLQLDINLYKEVQEFTIPDRCGISPFGQGILHEFSTDEECKLRCLNLCEVRDLNYFSHIFLFENRSCYECKCKCK